MTARHYLRNGSGSFDDITANVRLYSLDVTMRAEEGSPATSTIVVDDPDADLDIVGLRDYRIFEDTAAGSNTLLFAGYVADRKVHRGPYRNGASRVWDVNVVDINSYLSRRLLTNTVDAARPAETDIARVRWLMDTWQVVNIGNEQFINSSSPVQMDKTDYRGQSAAEVLDDCAQQSGKNWFLWFDVANTTYGLWYDYDISTSWSSPLRLSNDLADVDETTTFAIAFEDTSLSRDPSRLYSGVRVEYDGGVVFIRRGALATSIGGAREVAMPAFNVKTAARATARANRYLDDLGTEEDVITTSVLLPRAQAGLILAGMRVQFKATHLPGYEDFLWLRCISRNVVEESETHLRLNLDLATGGGGAEEVEAGCVGGIYPLTEDRHFTPLGAGGSDAEGLVWYAQAAVPTMEPHPLHSNLWGFPEYNGPSGVDYAGDCTLSALYFFVVGAGTLTVQTAVYGGVPRGMYYDVYHINGGVGSFYISDVPFTSGDEIEVVVNSHADDENCAHIVRVRDNHSSCGGKWGWSGADWAAGVVGSGEGGGGGATAPSGGSAEGGTGGTLVAATNGALAAAIAAASNGDVLTLRGGNHVLGAGVGSGYGGITVNKALTIQNYTGEVPNITWDSSTRNNGLYFTGTGPSLLSGITFTASSATTHDSNGSAQVELDGGSNLTITDCTFIGHANMDDHQQLVYQRFGSNIIVRRSVFRANGSEGFGFHQYPGSSFDPNCRVEDCTFELFTYSGGVTSDSRITVIDSVFNDNNIAVQLRNDADGSVITGNSGTGNTETLQNNVSGVTDSGNTWT